MTDDAVNPAPPSRTKLAETARILLQAAAASLKEAGMCSDPEGVLSAFYALPGPVRVFVVERGCRQLERQHDLFKAQAEKNAVEFDGVIRDVGTFFERAWAVEDPCPLPVTPEGEPQL